MFKGIHVEYVESYNGMKKEGYSLNGSIQDVSYWYVDEKNHSVWHSSLNQEESLSKQKEMLVSMPNNNMVITVKISGNLCRVVICLSPDGIVTASRTRLGDRYNSDKKTEDVLSKLGVSLGCYIVDALNSKETLIGSANVKNKTLSGRDKVIPIVYISSKKLLAQSKKLHPQVIDWRHSWEVLGHWRSVKNIGKNRDGEYGIIGKTWVNPCVKGNGELIKKIRLFK